MVRKSSTDDLSTAEPVTLHLCRHMLKRYRECNSTDRHSRSPFGLTYLYLYMWRHSPGVGLACINNRIYYTSDRGSQGSKVQVRRVFTQSFLHLVLACTCGGIHPRQVQPPSPMEFTTPGSTVLRKLTRSFRPVLSPSFEDTQSNSALIEVVHVFSWPLGHLRHMCGGVESGRPLISSPSGRLELTRDFNPVLLSANRAGHITQP